MISVSAFTRAISENTMYAIGSVPAYDFATDNINECFSTLNNSVASDYADYLEIVASTDEILAEAAMSGSSNIYRLNESVFSTIKEKVVNFFKKLIEKIKGLITALKAFLYKLRGKVDSWLNTMESQIGKIKDKKGYEKVEMEMNQWDIDYITTNSGSSMIGGVAALADTWKTEVDTKVSSEGEASVEVFKTFKKTQQTNASNSGFSNEGRSDTAVKSARDKLDKDTKALSRSTEDYADKVAAGKVQTAFGLAGVNVSDKTAFETGLRRKAHKGKEGKSSYKITSINGGIDGMKNALSKSTQAISDLQDAYEKHLKGLVDFENKLESEGKDIDIDNSDKYPSEYISSITDYVKAQYNYYMKVTTVYEGYMNATKGLNTQLIQEMDKEFMNALTKLINFRGESK